MSARFAINPASPTAGALFRINQNGLLESTDQLDVPTAPFVLSLANNTDVNYQLLTKSSTGDISPVTGLVFPAGHTTTIDGFDLSTYGDSILLVKRADSNQEWSFVPSEALNTMILQGIDGVDPCKRPVVASAPQSAPSAPTSVPSAPSAPVKAAVAADIMDQASGPLGDQVKQILTIKAVCDKSKDCSAYWIGWIILVIIFFILTWAFYQVGKYELWSAALISALIVFVIVGWIMTLGLPKYCQDVANINMVLSMITLVILVILGFFVVVTTGQRKCHDGVVYDGHMDGSEQNVQVMSS